MGARAGLRRRGPALALALLAAALVGGWSGSLAAEDRVSVRGAYYREASNRIMQPMMELTKDLPAGYDVGGHFLVDAITSASIAQGASADSVFHENRYEGAINFGRTFEARRPGGFWGPRRLGAFYRYSNESDYKSHTGGLSLNQEVWDRTGTIGVNLAFTGDLIHPPPQDDKDLTVYFLGLGYTQALGQTTVAQAVYETYYLRGFMANPYLAHGSLGREKVPRRRLRHALALRLAQFIPRADLGAQLHYRFYFDEESLFRIGPWGMTAHTLEARLSKMLGHSLELRAAYRFHYQTAANFWCNARPDNGGDVSCYGMDSPYHSVDVKFGTYRNQLAEGKLIWDLRILNGTGLDVLAGGSFDVSYGYYFEGTPYGMDFNDGNAPPLLRYQPLSQRYGGAHLIQTGYSLPF
jgi:hypothetical protein